MFESDNISINLNELAKLEKKNNLVKEYKDVIEHYEKILIDILCR